MIKACFVASVTSYLGLDTIWILAIERQGAWLLEIQVTKVMFDFLNFKLRSEEYYSNHSSGNFYFQSRFKSLFNFHTINLSFIKFTQVLCSLHFWDKLQEGYQCEITSYNCCLQSKKRIKCFFNFLLLPLQGNRPHSLLAMAFSFLNFSCRPLLVLMKQERKN